MGHLHLCFETFLDLALKLVNHGFLRLKLTLAFLESMGEYGLAVLLLLVVRTLDSLQLCLTLAELKSKRLLGLIEADLTALETFGLFVKLELQVNGFLLLFFQLFRDELDVCFILSGRQFDL